MSSTYRTQAVGSSGIFQGMIPLPIISSRAPLATDTNYPIGQNWIRQTTNQCWILTSVVASAATWALSSPGASDVDTLTGDAGGAIPPAGGNITLAGGTNIGTTGAGNTVTFNLDNAITLATSVTSPLYTAGAGDRVQITAQAGRDIRLQMGDAAGANVVSFRNSGAAEVFQINSLGVIAALAGLTVAGVFTSNGGAVNLGTDNAANAISIGVGNVARVIGIGNGAAAHALTIGSVNGAASLLLQSGTGDVNVTSTDEINLDSVGVLQLNSSGAAISIGNDANAFAINIGNGAAQRDITIGNATGTTSFTLNAGTGAVGIANNAIQHNVTLGSVTGTSALTLQSGTGDVIVTSTDAITVDAVGVLELNSSAGVIGIGNDAIAQDMNIGTGAAQRVITIGNATLASSVVVNGGTGAMSFGANGIAHITTIGNQIGASSTIIDAGTGDLLLTSTDAMVCGATGDMTFDAVGIMQMNSSGAAISIGNDADAFAINLGTGAAQRVITIGNGTGTTSVVINNGTGALNIGTNATVHTTTVGSNTGASATVIRSGAGGIDFAGTVLEIAANFAVINGDDITFSASPVAQSTLDTCVIPTGVAATTDLLLFETGMIMEQFIIGTQAILAPRMAALGLTVSCDLTTAEGKEYSWGATRANSKHSFTIGTSAAFYLEWTFRVNDVSTVEPCYIGFRRTQANQAAYGAYTDFVGYGLNDGVAPGDCAISTVLNGGAQVDTDTNDAWADGATHTLRVLVSALGVVTFLFDGAPPTVTQAFTFDNGDVVHPFWTHLYNATVGVGDEIYWTSLEVGYQ